jgi:hypothetical protein
MQVLLNSKSYDVYLEIFFSERKNSEWENLLNNMKENNELEAYFKGNFIKEKEFDTIYYTINKLWEIYKSITFFNKYGNYPLTLLVEILEILYKQNIYNFIIKNKNLIELTLFVYIECLKINEYYNQALERLTDFLKIFKENLNLDIVRDILANEGYYELIDMLNIPPKTERLTPRAPTHLKIEMTKCLNYDDNGRLVTYIGNDYVLHTIRGNYPINSSIGIYYFEVEIKSLCDDT